MTHVAIGQAYATVAELHAWLKIPDSKTDRDTEFQRRLDSSSMDINRWCHRQFGRAEVASIRTFTPSLSGIDVHDFWDASGLTITPYFAGVAGTPWDVSMLSLEPLDGIVDMVPGWPYSRICSGGYSAGHPLMANLFYVASNVQVSAKWGWADVPANVNTACLILASADNKTQDTPFGVAAFGDYAVRIRSNPVAQEKLEPYIYRGTATNSYMVGAA